MFYALSGLLSGVPALSAQGSGQVAVTVVNKTAGGPLAGQPVTLLRHTDEGGEVQTVARGVTDPAGRCVFSGLPADGAHYVVETRYLDIPYMTGHIDLREGAAQHDVSLDVYDTTPEDRDLLLSALHLVIDVKPNLLDVTEILVFQNNGNRTYAPSSGAGNGLTLSLPGGAFQVQPMTEGVERTDQGLRFSQPIPPGTAQVVYAYSVDRITMGSRFAKQMDYPAGRIQVLISPSDQAATGSGLTNEGVRQIGDKTYLLLSNTAGLQRGMSVGIEFPGVMTLQEMMKWVMVGLAVLMAVSGLIIGLRTRPAAPEPAARSAARALTAEEERQYAALLEEIASLDDAYEAGALDEKAHRQRRKRLKDRAIRLGFEEDEDE